MEGDPGSDIIRQLEAEGTVPEYLKTSLVSEIDLIKDALQVVSLFGGVFFVAALKAVTSLSENRTADE